MFQIISIMIALGIGFACGYGVRELKSRRRRAVAREIYSRMQEQKRADSIGEPDTPIATRVIDGTIDGLRR